MSGPDVDANAVSTGRVLDLAAAATAAHGEPVAVPAHAAAPASTSTPAPAPADSGRVSALDARRIEKALARRTRYRYVHPRVLREGAGWKVVSPNCSRNIDPQGGEIDIAWLVPAGQGGWLLHARDHRQGTWVLKAHAATLSALLTPLCRDTTREFWP